MDSCTGMRLSGSISAWRPAWNVQLTVGVAIYVRAASRSQWGFFSGFLNFRIVDCRKHSWLGAGTQGLQKRGLTGII